MKVSDNTLRKIKKSVLIVSINRIKVVEELLKETTFNWNSSAKDLKDLLKETKSLRKDLEKLLKEWRQ